MKPFTCLRCGHTWTGRIIEWPERGVVRYKPPMRCPRCGSPAWNRPRTLAGHLVEAVAEGDEATADRGGARPLAEALLKNEHAVQRDTP